MSLVLFLVRSWNEHNGTNGAYHHESFYNISFYLFDTSEFLSVSLTDKSVRIFTMNISEPKQLLRYENILTFSHLLLEYLYACYFSVTKFSVYALTFVHVQRYLQRSHPKTNERKKYSAMARKVKCLSYFQRTFL